MKLCEAAILCEGNNRAFAEVYKIYNFKDDDDLRAYCDFVIHEPVEWMRGFPAAWKSATMFSKPRAAFHRLLRLQAVVEELGEAYCEQVHSVVWTAFKNNMTGILEKRAGTSVVAENDDTSDLTAESVDSETEELPPVPPVPPEYRRGAPAPKNVVMYTVTSANEKALDYKHKYEVSHRVLMTLLGNSTDALGSGDENARLRAALSLLLEEFSSA